MRIVVITLIRQVVGNLILRLPRYSYSYEVTGIDNYHARYLDNC